MLLGAPGHKILVSWMKNLAENGANDNVHLIKYAHSVVSRGVDVTSFSLCG